MHKKKNMTGLEALLVDAEKDFQDELKVLEKAHRLQLQETENRQREELEKRIHQDALLSINRESSHERQLDNFFNSQTRCRSSSFLASKGTSQQLRQLERTALSSPHVSVSSSAVRTSRATHIGTQQAQQQSLLNTMPSYLRKEEEAIAECQKQFRAAPVPSHVSLPLFHDMMKARDTDRKQGLEQRRNFLLSTQKPFSFLERDKVKRDKQMEMLSQVEQTQKNKTKGFTAKEYKVIKDAAISQTCESEKICMEVHTQVNGGETSQEPRENPSGTGRPLCAERAKRGKLAFLEEKPSFQPKINQQVPDFSRLHKAFQTEALRKAESKDVTKCRPFNLRTSAIPPRQSKTSPEKTQDLGESNHLKRSSSLGGLTSLSADTLPFYITDAARIRCMAIRRSVELRDSKEQESAEWMRSYQTKAEAMKKAVSLRAKVMDPHSSLKEVYHEKLQQHREADQQRVKDYTRELQNMKARVTIRPFLFERLKQKNAVAHAEQVYRNKLKEAGLNESFVEANGVELGLTPVTCGSEEDSDTDGNDSQISEENVDDGKKIEDVEEKSVKFNGEELS